jgi:hypothetical protein
MMRYRVQSFVSPMQNSLMGSMSNLTGTFSQFGMGDVSKMQAKLLSSLPIQRVVFKSQHTLYVDIHTFLVTHLSNRCQWEDQCPEIIMARDRSTTTITKDPAPCFTSQ